MSPETQNDFVTVIPCHVTRGLEDKDHKAKFLLVLKKNDAKLDKRRFVMKKAKKNKLAKMEEAKRRLSAVNEEVKK